MKIGYSVYGKDSLTDSLACKLVEGGIEVLEIAMSAEEFPEADFAKTAEVAKRHGLEIGSIHLPIAPQTVYDVTNKHATGAMAYQSELIKRAEVMGIKHIVMHSGGEPLVEEERAERVKRAGEALPRLADVAGAYGADICIEDLPRTCLGRNSSDILDLISAHPALRVCFDTNHLLGESISDFIEKVGPHIITTHVSDYDEINERHWLPGEGVIDWKALKSELAATGYDGYWLYELGLSGSTKTVDRERALTHSDLKRNFDEITEYKPITKIGQGKKNLPMFP